MTFDLIQQPHLVYNPSKTDMDHQNEEPSSIRNSIASVFLDQLQKEVPTFLQAVETQLPFVQQYYADHVCWRTESMKEYKDLTMALRHFAGATLLIESIIGGRPIATFKLKPGIFCPESKRDVTILEIPSPKEGSPYSQGLEHVEFVLCNDGASSSSPINDAIHESTLEKFMILHSDIKWNVKAKNKKVNPDVSLNLELDGFGACSIKFHLLPLAKVIDYEIAHDTT
jgi:hypothetical protein